MQFKFNDIKPSKFGPYQASATLNQVNYPPLMFDIHWKSNNRLLLSNTLTFEEVYERAVYIPEYSSNTKGLNLSDALLMVCIHNAGSLDVERGKLIAMYDANLIIRKLDETTLEHTASLAVDKGIGKIFFDYILHSTDLFGTELDYSKLKYVQSLLSIPPNEPTRKLLTKNRSWLQNQYLDLQAMQGFNQKLEFVVAKLSRKL